MLQYSIEIVPRYCYFKFGMYFKINAFQQEKNFPPSFWQTVWSHSYNCYNNIISFTNYAKVIINEGWWKCWYETMQKDTGVRLDFGIIRIKANVRLYPSSPPPPKKNQCIFKHINPFRTKTPKYLFLRGKNLWGLIFCRKKFSFFCYIIQNF